MHHPGPAACTTWQLACHHQTPHLQDSFLRRRVGTVLPDAVPIPTPTPTLPHTHSPPTPCRTPSCAACRPSSSRCFTRSGRTLALSWQSRWVHLGAALWGCWVCGDVCMRSRHTSTPRWQSRCLVGAGVGVGAGVRFAADVPGLLLLL